jgi:hypothetical protein
LSERSQRASSAFSDLQIEARRWRDAGASGRDVVVKLLKSDVHCQLEHDLV